MNNVRRCKRAVQISEYNNRVSSVQNYFPVETFYMVQFVHYMMAASMRNIVK